jgi:hypothetical protein
MPAISWPKRTQRVQWMQRVALLRLLGAGRRGAHDHPLRDRRGAGGHRLRRFFDFDQAHPAVGRDRQLLVVAEVRHVDVELRRSIHHHAAFVDCDFAAVDFDFDHGNAQTYSGTMHRLCST